MTSADSVMSTPDFTRRARIAVSLITSMGRGNLQKHLRNGYPSEDTLLAIGCKAIDLGLDVEDERDVELALALVQSKLTIAELNAQCDWASFNPQA